MLPPDCHLFLIKNVILYTFYNHEYTFSPRREKRVIYLRSGQKTVLCKSVGNYANICFHLSSQKWKKIVYHLITIVTFLNLINICANLNSITDEICNNFPSFFFLSYRKFNFKRKKIIKKLQNNTFLFFKIEFVIWKF